jgi:cystathionine beta-lyase family protein involved in aluminum resistance
MSFSAKEIERLAAKAEADIAPVFAAISLTCEACTARVLEAFASHRVSEAVFAPSSGYGYGDRGRDTLDAVFAAALGTEDALVRTHFVNGSHAISTALFALLRPGDILLSATGAPYDTLLPAIGEKGLGALGVKYAEISLFEENGAFVPEKHTMRLISAVRESRPKAVYIQRSRGYSLRPPLFPDYINTLCDAVKEASPSAEIIVDNCYGEFVCDIEPNRAGLLCGSLIKNPGGGIAPTGAYIAGRRDLVELAAERLTLPGTGREAGSNSYGYRPYFQGLFLAPHTVGEALKTAVFAARLFELMGFEVDPRFDLPRSDIIQTLSFGAPEPLLNFMRGLHSGSPVDSFVTPEPWDMPGYSDQVVMAAGAFVQGASIELSADAPMREPYTAFMQGGLTYESGKLGILKAAASI